MDTVFTNQLHLDDRRWIRMLCQVGFAKSIIYNCLLEVYKHQIKSGCTFILSLNENCLLTAFKLLTALLLHHWNLDFDLRWQMDFAGLGNKVKAY